MDYQSIVDSYEHDTVIIAVNMSSGEDYGTIRLTVCNDAYKEHLRARGAEFYPGMLYTETMERNLSFEGFVLQSIVEKKPLHAYINAPDFNAWLSLFFMPIRSDDENISYCLFTFDVDMNVDAEKLAESPAEYAEQVLKTCIRLRETDDFNEAMDSIICDIREMCDADRCCILLTDFDKRECSVLCDDFRGGSGRLPMDTYINDDFFNIVESWIDTLNGSNCIVISDEREFSVLKEINPDWASSLEENGISSVVLHPLKSNNEILGFIWVVNYDTERTLAIKEILEITTFILSGEIATRQLFERMERMSRTDLLTGVYNRNAMNNRIDSYSTSSSEPFGVVFADLNALKYTNDTSGHSSGDELLRRAASILKDIFDGYEVYRAGGDEFMVFAPGINEYEFYTCVNSLKVLADSEQDFDRIFFAVGSCYCDIGEDVRLALREADKKMYKDKEKFYEKHPEMIVRR